LGDRFGGRCGLTVVGLFELDRRHHRDLAVKAAVVEPVDVLEGGELDIVEAAPWSLAADELGLVETVEALGQGVGPRCQRHPIGWVASELSG
jgi:hypothetical protein